MEGYTLFRGIIVIAILVCASCSSIATLGLENVSNITGSTPSFISNIEIVDSQNAYPYQKALCLTINQEALWEKSNTFDQLQNQLISTMKLAVDSYAINGFYLVTPALTVIRNKVDEGGKVIGTYTDPYTACYDIKNIKAGIHAANFTIQGVSASEHSFRWQFILKQ